MSELTKRILFAVPAAALFLWVTWLGGWVFTIVVAAILLCMQYEVTAISQKAGYKADPVFSYLFGLWILFLPVLPGQEAIGLALFLLFIGFQVFKQSEYGIQELVSTFFCGLYAPLGLLMLLMIRNSGGLQTGFVLTLSLLLMVWGNDVFAYFGGKAFGKHPLAPKVSPKKTWEGFLFGIAGAVAGLAITVYAVPIDFPVSFLKALPLAVLVSIFGPLGDLAESKLKRAAGVKDASGILPGHGGFFDRFDALILAAPAFYLYLHFLGIMNYANF